MQIKKITTNSHKAKEYFLEEISFTISPESLKDKLKDDLKEMNVIDVRAYDDYIDGHIPFAIHIPIETLDEHLAMLDKDKINIIYSYCPYCTLGAKAAYLLAEKGYITMVLRGGYYIWSQKGFETVKTSANE